MGSSERRLGEPDVCGILLTGGASRRMGFDKASMLVGGVPCAVRVAGAMSGIVAEAVEVGPGVSGLRAVHETPPGGGPLVAVCTGAAALGLVRADAAALGLGPRRRPALVLACDLPLVSEAVLRVLAGWPGTGSVVPVVGGRPQPLCARWSAADLAVACDLVDEGESSMQALLRRADVELLDEEDWPFLLDSRALSDVDTPADLERLGLRGGRLTPEPVPGPDWLAVSAEPLPLDAIAAWVTRPGCGAVVTFCGTVRDHSEGRSGVVSLDYEAYLEQVEPCLAKVAAAARQRWPAIGRLALLHRVGRLRVGETSVVVAVSTPHRAEAFDTARFCIDSIKATVPIWKRETWAEGSGWVSCTHDEGVGP